ncbi:MAG: hypothetical protein O3A93_10315 [Chloroflexi bacterium]|nr:hypothetical protein [Chloroflexota bacterium]MDA1271637.1 hypothetical protein [Chloroflexota bacterium]
MPESKLDEVANKLLGQSKENKVNWEDTGKRGTYRVFFPDVALAITKVYPSSEDSELCLELMNESGSVIDYLETAPGDRYHSLLSQIFDFAQQHVRDAGINKALEYLKEA